MSSVANKLTAFVMERWQIYTNTEQMHANMEFNYIYTVYYVFAFGNGETTGHTVGWM